jgi:hypothetical protein
MKKSDETSPIINFLFQDSTGKLGKQYVEESINLMKARHKINLSSIKWHQKVLGKQNYCWTGSSKNWIWETDVWRVYVSKEGAAFEVLASLALDEAWAAWQDYYNKMK